MKIKKFIFIASILTIIFIAAAEKSYACSCIVTLDPLEKQIQKAYGESNAVFSGEIVQVKPKDENTISVKIKTAQVWKGEDLEEFTITTPSNSAMCGYNFEVGEKYIVYANKDGEALTTNLCSRTQLFDGSDDTKHLDVLTQTLIDTIPKVRLKNGVIVNSTIGGEAHDSYVIRVKKGQTLKVQTSWKGNRDRNVNFHVTRSADFYKSDEVIRGIETYDGKNWRLKIRKTGDYYIYVTAHPTADYTIKATVK